MKYHSLFGSKIRKDITKFVVCCSCDWRFKGSCTLDTLQTIWTRIFRSSLIGFIVFTFVVKVSGEHLNTCSRSRVDPGFLERVFICIKVWGVRFADFISFLLNIT